MSRRIAIHPEAFLMELCKCGAHPRIMPAWVLPAVWLRRKQ